jgi:hypothetical protein
LAELGKRREKESRRKEKGRKRIRGNWLPLIFLESKIVEI